MSGERPRQAAPNRPRARRQVPAGRRHHGRTRGRFVFAGRSPGRRWPPPLSASVWPPGPCSRSSACSASRPPVRTLRPPSCGQFQCEQRGWPRGNRRHAGGQPPALAPKKPWIPEGFAAPAAAGIDTASGLSNQLKREDGALFTLYRDGMYLPVGYKPEDPETAPATWPKAIVRKSDAVRFIWIDGGTYRRGDPRPDQGAATDGPGNPLTPHHVRLGGFYIQETEVTNGEIQRYLDAHPDEEKNLRTWRDAYESFRSNNQIDDTKMSQYPAVCVGYGVAIKYAASVGGRLPTEAQWEFAAKSRHDDYLFAWGKEFPRSGERPANLEPSQAASAPVKAFPGDKTEQGVYDMTGNVRELCADAYQPYDELKLAANSADHPLVDRREKLVLDSSEAGQIKIVVRGGSYMDSPRKAMTFMRDRLAADDDVPGDVGFRVVIECPSRADQSGDDHP